MYKKFLIIFFLSFFLFIQNKSIAQIDFITEVQWIIYRTPDTNINVTKYINQEGLFFFKRGFIDTSLLLTKKDSNTINTIFYRIEKNSFQAYKLRCHYIRNIDTLQSIFSTNNSFNVLPKEIVKKYNKVTEIYYEDIFLDEVRFSYILRQLGEKPIYNSEKDEIRVLFPVNKKDYQMVRIVLNDTSKLHFVFGKSEDSLGIRVNERVSYLLGKSDVKRIKKRLSGINIFSSLNCTRPGYNTFLIEYNYNSEYKRFFASDMCLRGKKEFKKINRFCNYLMSMNIKYKRYKYKTSTIPDKQNVQ
jgi:hypothetical protein